MHIKTEQPAPPSVFQRVRMRVEAVRQVQEGLKGELDKHLAQAKNKASDCTLLDRAS